MSNHFVNIIYKKQLLFFDDALVNLAPTSDY